MSVFRPKATALITGGSSGIGYAVAELCLENEMHVAIVDINDETLAFAAKELGRKGKGQVTGFKADVSKASEWKSLREKVDNWAKGEIDFLMLNAAIGTKGTWGDEDYFEKVLSTNLFGVLHGLNTYVPSFLSRPSTALPSTIVITGSKQGITNPPGNAAYNASKSAVKTLAEHLAFDLRDTQTSVHLLVPGWTFTGLSGNLPNATTPIPKPTGAWHSSQVASYMHQKIQDGKFYIICPDEDVSEETDKKRMLWSVGDVVDGRPPLTRWRPEWKERAEEWMGEVDAGAFAVRRE